MGYFKLTDLAFVTPSESILDEIDIVVDYDDVDENVSFRVIGVNEDKYFQVSTYHLNLFVKDYLSMHYKRKGQFYDEINELIRADLQAWNEKMNEKDKDEIDMPKLAAEQMDNLTWLNKTLGKAVGQN
jgi:hypothetical protein